MRTQYPFHESGVTRGLSPRLWNNIPLDLIFGGGGHNAPDVGWGLFEDFMSVTGGSAAGTLALRCGGAVTAFDSGGSVLQLGGNETSSANPGAGGVLRLLGGGTDNDHTSVQFCGTTGEPFFVSDTAANARDLVFEARFRTNTITVNDLDFFIGLAECGMSVADALLSDDDPPVMNQVAHIGLHVSEDDPTDGIWAYGANGQTVQSKQAAFIVTTVGTTIAVDTWYKFGFRYNAGAGTVTPYWDGTAYTDDNITSTNVAAATFPDGEGMAPVASMRVGGAFTDTLDFDWIACAQVEAIG